MPFVNQAERRAPEQRPRVRPGVWFLLFLVAGFGVLYLGAMRSWFVATLGSETYPELKFALSWATLGLACGLLATFAWALLTHSARMWKSWRAPLLVCALMVGGSQYAARDTSDRLVLVIDGIRWDHEAKALMLHAMAAPSVAHAYERGELEATALVESWSIGPSGVEGMGMRPGERYPQAMLRDLREDTATPPSAHLDGVALVELGYIPASWSQESEGDVWLNALPPSNFPEYLFLAAKVTLVNRAQHPVGRTAGATFLLRCGTEPAFFPNDHEISKHIRQARSVIPPEEHKE